MKKSKKLQDTSPTVHQKNKIKSLVDIKEREYTEKQKQFINLALDKNTKMVFVSGPAGTSKTYLAVLVALKLLNQKRVSDLLYIRSAVESSDSKIGFLPGEANEKLAPYLQPLLDKLSELTDRATIDWLQKEERVGSVPVSFLRGLNWNAKCIITDEAQNMTYKELVTLVTRIGEFSKVFVLGDPDQCDIGSKSGFVKLMNAFDNPVSNEHGIYHFKFEENDIVRSELVKFMIKMLRKSN